MKKNIFVICTNNVGYEASLEARKLYQVIPDASAEKYQHLRIVDESGEDYVYPNKLFVSINLPTATVEQIANIA